MPYPLPLTRTEAYLAYKAGVIQQLDLKPSLAVPRNGIDAWLAYWTELTNDYPKNPDGTPMILQEEEAYIAYLCGVLDTYPEKCLRRVGAYLRYLISARWGRPDHPLNREELYLSLLKTQVIPSGDPSSDITIDGTAKAAFQDVKMYGDTAQDSYTGKNLLEIRPSDNSRGLTVVPNTRTGEITFSGTTTAGYPWLDESSTDLPAGTYTFSIDKPVGKTLYLRLYNKDGTYPVTLQFTAGNTSDTKTTDYAIERTVMLYGEASSGATVAEQTIKPMLEAGSSVTSFEPYVGGTPSPNPDYPQTIQTVTGEQTVTVVGKNLFDKDSAINGKVLSADGTLENSTSEYYTSDFIPVEPNTAYYKTFSLSVRFKYYGADKAALSTSSYQDIANAANAQSFTTPSEAYYVRLSLGAAYLNTLQIELGSTASSYAPYHATSYPLDLGTIELCKIGTYQDYIWKDGEDWKIHKATNTKVYDGTNQGFYYRASTSMSGKYRFQLDGSEEERSIAQSSANTYFNGFCNELLAGTRDMTFQIGSLGGNTIAPRTTSGYGNIGVAYAAAISEMTLDEANTWLATHNMVVTYALETPTDTVITNQALIDQLNALKQGGAENGTTHIKVNATDPNLPGLLYVEAPKYE